jgi:hypothetical protein
VNDAPATRGIADRPAVVNLTGVGVDDFAWIAADVAAPAPPDLRAAIDETEAIAVVPVAAEVMIAVDYRAVDAGDRQRDDSGAMQSAGHAQRLRHGCGVVSGGLRQGAGGFEADPHRAELRRGRAL